MEQALPLPVYFAEATSELARIHASLSGGISAQKAGTPGKQPSLLSTLAVKSYRINVETTAAVPHSSGVKFQNADVLLRGHSSNQGGVVPTIAIVAHVDSFGLAPGLSHGVDSDATGVVALIELARLFSTLYSSPHTRGKYDLLFLFTGAGKLNYEGSKRWLESHSSSLPSIEFALCLDSLGGGDDLFFHVSKPPTEGTRAHDLLHSLRDVAASTGQGLEVTMVHKKINTAQKSRSWEHEQYRLKGVQSATVSHHEAADSSETVFPRSHLLDSRDNVSLSGVQHEYLPLLQIVFTAGYTAACAHMHTLSRATPIPVHPYVLRCPAGQARHSGP